MRRRVSDWIKECEIEDLEKRDRKLERNSLVGIERDLYPELVDDQLGELPDRLDDPLYSGEMLGNTRRSS